MTVRSLAVLTPLASEITLWVSSYRAASWLLDARRSHSEQPMTFTHSLVTSISPAPSSSTQRASPSLFLGLAFLTLMVSRVPSPLFTRLTFQILSTLPDPARAYLSETLSHLTSAHTDLP